MTIVAIIPARAGSKRLVGKNLLLLKKKPLIIWTIDFAKKLKFLKEVIVTTDDKKLISLIKNYDLTILQRPKYLARDNTSTISVILDILKKYKNKFKTIDTILLLQPTSPFRSINIVKLALKKYFKFKKKKSIVSVNHTFNTNLKKFKFQNKKKYNLNGNFYIVSKNFLIKNKSFLSNKHTFPYKIYSKKLQIDIDTKSDFNFAKKIIKKKYE